MYNDDHVANYIVPATGTVPPTEPIGRIRHLMESDNLASVIVAEDNRPVGMIRRNDVFDGARLPDFCLARDIMLPNCPTLQVNSPADEARNSLDVTNLDRLPVVNANGELLGVVSRSALRWQHHSSTHVPGGWRRRTFIIRPGMNVFSSNGVRLGLVDRMFVAGGTVTGFLIAYGRVGNRHKHMSFDVVDRLEGETILLSIDEAYFSLLSDADAF